ncbi:MAG TPA: SDR family NAD(P)-dependent oxidoreductase [Polyangiaceae bacterium]|nr:SDR family NAD(P)-dependent oxidoreductase [Polyangiaceae bacterium]
MTDKTVLITGATSSIGLLTARELAAQGARTIITGRDVRRGERAAVELRRFAGHDRVHFLRADSTTIEHNRELAETVLTRFSRLDVLINHVEASFEQRWETEEGHEATLATNVLGPYALTGSLLPLLKRSAPSRIVNVTSGAFATIMRHPFEDLNAEHHYDGLEVFARSKMLRILWTFALARKLASHGVVVNAADSNSRWHAASKASVFLASTEDHAEVTGTYLEDSTKPAHATMRTLDVEDQDRVWDLCTTLMAAAKGPRPLPRPRHARDAV